jgi:hypothetical protein
MKRDEKIFMFHVSRGLNDNPFKEFPHDYPDR